MGICRAQPRHPRRRDSGDRRGGPRPAGRTIPRAAGKACLDLPAGLVGDDDSLAGEDAAAAAKRELEEETGYRAARMEVLGEFFSSPGMVSESFTLLRAHGLERVGPGGGTDGEDITVHRVPLAELPAFIESARKRGLGIDVRLLMLLGPGILGGR